MNDRFQDPPPARPPVSPTLPSNSPQAPATPPSPAQMPGSGTYDDGPTAFERAEDQKRFAKRLAAAAGVFVLLIVVVLLTVLTVRAVILRAGSDDFGASSAAPIGTESTDLSELQTSQQI